MNKDLTSAATNIAGEIVVNSILASNPDAEICLVACGFEDRVEWVVPYGEGKQARQDVIESNPLARIDVRHHCAFVRLGSAETFSVDILTWHA